MDIQYELDVELMRLQAKYGYATDYKVKWFPSDTKFTFAWNKTVVCLRGQVFPERKEIEIYDKTLKDCLHTLLHEFFEVVLNYLISKFIQHYNDFQRKIKTVLSEQLKLDVSFCEQIYHTKEELIETLVKFEEEEKG